MIFTFKTEIFVSKLEKKFVKKKKGSKHRTGRPQVLGKHFLGFEFQLKKVLNPVVLPIILFRNYF